MTLYVAYALPRFFVFHDILLLSSLVLKLNSSRVIFSSYSILLLSTFERFEASEFVLFSEWQTWHRQELSQISELFLLIC